MHNTQCIQGLCSRWFLCEILCCALHFCCIFRPVGLRPGSHSVRVHRVVHRVVHRYISQANLNDSGWRCPSDKPTLMAPEDPTKVMGHSMLKEHYIGKQLFQASRYLVVWYHTLGHTINPKPMHGKQRGRWRWTVWLINAIVLPCYTTIFLSLPIVQAENLGVGLRLNESHWPGLRIPSLCFLIWRGLKINNR